MTSEPTSTQTSGTPTPTVPPTLVQTLQGGLNREEQRTQQQRQLDLARRTEEFNQFRALYRWRLWIGSAVFLIAGTWLVADVVLTLAVGWGTLNGSPFRLESSVVIAFLTTSTATVIGLFLVFLRWLYPQGPERSNERPEPRDEPKGTDRAG
ncbi:hypothetical protein [Deinococcus sp. QL22]|uniref:hypothetical protein n=1 Tax=Deinococcus sp. QL22 TaxID=2939437 RepID=UPI0020178C93|nr:hypothetical protein [Deinococcus sp. QL22]UQN07006.1 hypothetical protein M1R55_03590 [Deinococcus sp. QL22]